MIPIQQYQMDEMMGQNVTNLANLDFEKLREFLFSSTDDAQTCITLEAI